MIVLQPGLVLFPTVLLRNANEDNPLIGYQNFVPSSSLVASSETADNPVTFLSTPFTYQRWSGTAPCTVDIFPASGAVADYLAIARHNFGSAQCPITIYGATDIDPDYGPNWFELIPQHMLADDSPVMYRFTSAFYLGLRIDIEIGLDDPTAAVVYAGELLMLPRRLYVGHQVMPYNKQSNILTGISETGQFLGRIVRSQFLNGQIAQSNVPPDYFRSKLKPWVDSIITAPFFFAWRPSSYPTEVVYCWSTGDSTMQGEKANGFVSTQVNLQGIVT